MKSKLTLPVILFFALLLGGCSAATKFRIEHAPGSIPSDIKKNGYVLLVLKQDVGAFRNTQNRGVEKLMRKYYGAAFEMVSVEDLKNRKYDNTDVYRYVIGRDFNTGTLVTTSYINKMGASVMTTHLEYHTETIFDRKENKAFPSIDYTAASYSLGIKGFAKYMRKKK